MAVQVIVPPGTAKPVAPYSPGTKAGGVIYTAGIVAIDDAGKTVGIGDIKAQTRHVLDTIKAIVAAGGGSMKDVAVNHIFLKDYADYAGMNEVYREYFPSNPPARYCVRADLVRAEWLVEIASIAHVG